MGEPSNAALRGLLADVTVRDEYRLRRRLDGVRSIRDPRRATAARSDIAAEIERLRGRVEARRAAVPPITFPAQLPVSARRDDLAATIREHQVVIVAGETGSGKTTQLPKICLELGRGARGMIGHTQPRRIAARSVAERIAEELATPLGELVGYQVRFTDRVSDDTQVKVMTDGVLLAEIQRDRLLTRYDTIIVDEAHERSLNIDFLLGYLHQLLPRRPDLKLIITSATIDPQRFSAHFGGAPVIEVSGRTYPVEIRYRPLVEEYDPDDEAQDESQGDGAEPRDQVQAVCDAVRELAETGPGDVLVFLSGEREIRDAADALTRIDLRHCEIVPLFARLSAGEQHRVFEPHTHRRVVLATNVAETSLTVPGIRYVVDTGTARISRYSTRLKVQRLPVEPISQASANQRAGRCGRLEAGVAIRLYSPEDFERRPAFTDPEILRTNLASVILQMAALGLGDVAAFPFIDPPDARAVRDGVELLRELGALDPAQPDPRKRLTPLGRQLAQLPVDPRLARMVVEGHRNGCAHEVIVIAAALAIPDPRERPLEHQQAADEAHRRFADPRSDFLTYLNLWDHLREQRGELSSSAFRRMCKREFLNYVRLREWQDLVAQLRQMAKSLGVTVGEPLERDPSDGSSTGGEAAVQRIHTSLLAGLLSHVGLRQQDSREYLGARGAKFALWPGSALAKKPPAWVMAAELVETSRLWGRVAGRVEPEWIEKLAGHLTKRAYAEPHWSRKQAAVVASERVTLYGIPLVAGRVVQYGRIDPGRSRELFIRHALVEGDWDTRHEFFHANRALLDDVEDLENRARRRDLLVDDETLFAFYDKRLPEDVVSGRHFDAWWKKERRSAPDLLTFTPELLVADGTAGVDYARDFPDTWRQSTGQSELALRLSYAFEPGTPDDGVTVSVPLPVLPALSPEGFEWLVPGLREELVTALVRGLPKAIRTSLVPAPDHARAVLPALAAAHERGEALLPALSRELGARAGLRIPLDAWDLGKLPPHLRITFRIMDERGRLLGDGKDLDDLKRSLAPRIRTAVARATGPGLERTGLRTWPADLAELPRSVTRTTLAGSATGQTVQGYPALVDRGASVALEVLPSQAEQAAAMPLGVRRLLLSDMPSPAASVLARLDTRTKLTLASAPHAWPSALFDDCLACAVDALVADAGGPPWTADGYRQLREVVRRRLQPEVSAVLGVVATVLAEAAAVDRALRAATSLVVLASVTDVREQVAALVYPGFVAATGRRRLPDVVRYLKAARHRLEVLPEHPRRDADRMGRVHAVRDEYAAELADWPQGRPVPPELAEIRWMLEELRVSLFAQNVRTAYPVSEKRILKALDLALSQS
jgi:ATP-dependent helicase HrpA